MLSRVADSLYWLSRYIERAENLARIVSVSRHSALDARGLPSGADPWSAVLSAIEADSIVPSGRVTDVSHFISFGDTNPDSIRQCLANARENARMVRDQISEEMWLELNGMHLFFKSGEAERIWRYDPNAFTRRIIQFSLLFQGLADATILRDEGWEFVRLGTWIERADKTTRVLDILTHDDYVEPFQCAAVLRSCSAFSAFREEFRGDISLPNVTSFLLFSQSFPRSVRFCVRGIDRVLHEISKSPTGTFSNEAERLAGSLVATMNFYDLEKVQSEGLHTHLDTLQAHLNDIGQRIFESYVLLPSEIKSVTRAEGVQQQLRHNFFPEQQQQQQ